MRGCSAFLLAAASLASISPADWPAGRAGVLAGEVPGSLPRIVASGIDGALVICGGAALPDAAINEFMRLAGVENAHLVVIPTAGQRADDADAEELLKPWRQRKPASLVLLHTRSRREADTPAFVEPLRRATGVWFGGGAQSRISEAYVGTAVEHQLHALLRRGGVIGGTSAGAAVMSRLMIARGNPVAELGVGFDFLPGAVIDQHFLRRNRKPRLVRVIEEHPHLVGYGIDEQTALIAKGRKLRVLGQSTVTVCLAASTTRPFTEIVLKPGSVADLTALRRAVIARTLTPFPPAEPPVPNVESGSLVIVGGGEITEEVLERFIELAGGPDSLIVVIPTASPDPVPKDPRHAQTLRQAGAKNVKILHARTPVEVGTPEFLGALRHAGGIWFCGGRQWRLVDAYAETKAHQLFHDVLRRGGVIGGSSAGATIQADYLVRGNPLGNRQMMAEGYERGLGFLPGAAIDQHFSQRKRLRDMTALVEAHPQLLGIGIDESTALIVTGHAGEVIGRHNVYFYDRHKPVEEGKPDYEIVGPGGRYDLGSRKTLEQGSGQPRTAGQGASGSGD